MGSWGSGLFDSDHALSALGRLERGVQADLVAEQACAGSAVTAARTAAMLGVLLQLGSSLYEEEPDAIRGYAAAQLPHAVATGTREFLGQLAAGGDAELVACRGERSAQLAQTLGDYVNHVRPDAAYDEAPAREYVLEFVERCATAVDGYLGDGYDAYNTRFAGALGAIVLFAPGTIVRERAQRWHSVASASIAAVEDDGDREDLELLLESVQRACELVAAA